MTTLDTTTERAPLAPPYSSLARRGAGLCLVLAGLLNGGAQYLTELLAPDHEDFSAQIRWGVEHAGVHQAEQLALVVSMLFLPLGLLGLAQVARWHSRRLTAVGLLLALWGMWGFHNVVALGYAAGSVAPEPLGVDAAVELNEAFLEHPGVVVTALLPHLLGSFIGLLLLSIACWRSGSFPRVPLALLSGFLVWDFLLPSVGPLEPHLLLMVALCWLGVHLFRMSPACWFGATD